MQANWLFQIPNCPLTEVEPLIEARLEADPEARSISLEEAEAFMVSAYCLAFAAPATFKSFAEAFGSSGSGKNKAFRRQVTLMVLRSWREQRTQEMLKIVRGHTYMKGLGSESQNPTELPLTTLVDAYYDGHMLVWLCHLLRLSGRADQIPALFAELPDFAPALYEVHLNVGRLMLRRLVDGVSYESTRPKEGTHHLEAQLRQKARGAAQAKKEIARQQADKIRQERWRKAKEAALATYLVAVGEEIAATEALLVETATRHEAELDALKREHQAQLDQVVTEVERLEAGFAKAVMVQTTAWPLLGLHIALKGAWGAAERILIESAGGQIVTERPDLTLCLGASGPEGPTRLCTLESGPTGLERLLHRRVLPQITRFRPT